MSAPRPFQYAKSADPDVIAAIERNETLYPQFVAKVTEWAESLGLAAADVRMSLMFGDGYRVTHVARNPEGHGVWTKKGTPHATQNRPERGRMDMLTVRKEAVPGLPTNLMAESREGSYFLTAAPFISQGAAWVAFSRRPTAGGTFGPQWVEVKGSEAMAAREALEADRWPTAPSPQPPERTDHGQ